MTWKNTSSILSLFILLTVLSGCIYERSGATGWNYNDTGNGGFEKTPLYEQTAGPGLTFIEGGTFTMGQVEDDLMGSWDNSPRRVTVSSFYMDETEVTNHYWGEYLAWLERIYGDEFPEIVERALPDTLAWREKLAYNEPLVRYYLRHSAYRDYPVVGVSWQQATDFCKWRTDRVNEQRLIDNNVLVHNQDAQTPDDHFTTEGYLNGKYTMGELAVDGVLSFGSEEESRRIKMEDGLLLPIYRLPTEAEWEYAALGLVGNSYGELIEERRTYPWDGHYIRKDDPSSKERGNINANFVRGRGDFMGIAGDLNDFGDITVKVTQYDRNDYGLYNMAGNVNEWVMDVYRPFSNLDNEEFRPFRGNNYQTKVLDPEGQPDDPYEYVLYDLDRIRDFLEDYQKKMGEARRGKSGKDEELLDDVIKAVADAIEKRDANELGEEEVMTLVQDALDMIVEIDNDIKENEMKSLIAADLRKGFSKNIIAAPGDMKYRDVKLEENLNRTNYRVADNIDYRDGDFESSTSFSDEDERDDSNRMYDYGGTSLINNESRVYKGGSWNDRAYWLVPGTRRFLDERKSSSTIGFRCAMTRLGSPVEYQGLD
jgi:formylglycine-generating enzyme required for sulfatase activity